MKNMTGRRGRRAQIKKDLAARIQDYLSVGGLFNPEAMEHNKVRDLLLDVRQYLNNQ